jgi:hypothetical protein
MGVNGKFADITRDDLLRLADQFAIGSASAVLKQVAESVSAWPEFAARAKVDPKTIMRIRNDHRVLPPGT